MGVVRSDAPKRIKIGSTTFDVPFTIRTQQRMVDAMNAETARIDFDLNLVPPLSFPVQEFLSVQVEHEGQWAILFSGYIVRSDYGGRAYNIVAENPRVLLEESYLESSFGPGFSPTELLYFVLKQVTPDMVHEDSFDDAVKAHPSFPFRVSQGESLECVAPLPGLVAPSEPIQFRGCRVMSKSEGEQLEAFAGRSFQGSTPPQWMATAAKLAVKCQTRDWYDAIQEGREAIAAAQDLLSFAAGYGRATYWNGEGHVSVPYERERIHVRYADPSTLAIMENGGSNGRYLFRLLNGIPTKLSHDLLAHPAYGEFESMLSKVESKNRGAFRRCSLALSAFRSSAESLTALEQLNHLFRSIEFLVYGMDPRNPLPAKDVKALKKAANAAYSDLYPEAPRHQIEAMKSRLDFLYSKLSDDPLQTKWWLFCEDLGLAPSTDDRAFLNEMRKVRNRYIHGQTASTTIEDVRALRSLLQIVLASYLAQMANS